MSASAATTAALAPAATPAPGAAAQPSATAAPGAALDVPTAEQICDKMVRYWAAKPLPPDYLETCIEGYSGAPSGPVAACQWGCIARATSREQGEACSERCELPEQMKQIEADLDAIARAAAAAYQRDGQLCGSAVPVPAAPPSNAAHTPLPGAGVDFFSGDARNGWSCLRYVSGYAIHCQYGYLVGSGFKSLARGHALPEGSSHFEVSAECDLDGDGETSLVAKVGWLEAGEQQLTVPGAFFVDREGE
jgi:hypothetical protein